VNELAEPFEMSQPAISKHLKVLERAGLISRGLDAQRRPRRLEAQRLGEANEWLERYRQFWEASFKRLDALLLELKGGQSRLSESMTKESKTQHSKSQHLKTQESKTHGKKHGRTKRHGK
jgi:DNA-binding MarR family transcriptional regulator